MSYSPAPITSCFENLIGLRGQCATIDSASPYYANDIEITSDFIQEIITREYASVTDFHTKKLAFSVKKVIAGIKEAMAGNFRVATLLDDARVGFYQDNLVQIAGDGTLKGININLGACDAYLDLFISEIALQTDRDGDITVAIYDLTQDKLLDTVTIPCVANEISRAFPRITYKAERQKLNLAFVYDSTGISSNTTYLNKNGCSGCGNKKWGINNPYEKIQAISIDPADQKVNDSLTAIRDTGGMSIVHSLSCNHESWMCAYSNLVALPVLYMYGIEVMEFAKYVSVNDRINTTLNINSEEIQARLDIYKEKFNSEFRRVMENIKTPTNKECFTCRTPVRHVISL